MAWRAQPQPPPPAAPEPADWSHLPADQRLERELELLLAARAPPPEDERNRRATVDAVSEIAHRLWRGARVRMFGSSASGLHTRGADLDLCLMPPHPPQINAARRMITVLGEALKSAGMLDVLPLPSARVPIVKFTDSHSKIQCDICVNNHLALANTALLAAYAAVDPRVRPLICAVKYWAARRKVNEPYRGTLSSYAYVLMVIGYLQTTEPPVLPCLQQLARPDGAEQVVDGYDVWFNDDARALGEHFSRGRNGASLSQLLAGFFKRYSTDFKPGEQTVCPRLGCTLGLGEKVWGESQTANARKGRKADRHLFCIEDPFEVTHDLGRVMDSSTLKWVTEELARAHALLQRGASLSELCAEWTAAEEEQRRPDPPPDDGADANPAGGEAAAEAVQVAAAEELAVAALSAGLAAAALDEGECELEPDESAVQLPSGLF
ncbi:hypothetical protein T492DRAFT_1022438 [Pavlovales sp. CCMP2436]|nr:hypothetical protein T492DRAFT_1022438 [Pavlovales sp. CCMP2436]